LVVSDKKIFFKFQPMRTHYGHWQPCWISNQHQKHKSGRGPSNEHFWQVWLKSVQRLQRRFKCEKPTDGRMLTHDKSSHGLWPGELKNHNTLTKNMSNRSYLTNQRLPGACNRSPGSKLLSITTQLHCGGHPGGRAQLPDTILEEDHPMTIPSKFGFN
jgi:hypothetical protein